MRWIERAIMGEAGALASYWTRADGHEITPNIVSNINGQRVEYERTDQNGKLIGELHGSVRSAKADA